VKIDKTVAIVGKRVPAKQSKALSARWAVIRSSRKGAKTRRISMDVREIEAAACDAKKAGMQCVVVIGIGFVGTAVVANLAGITKRGKPLFFVVGLEKDNPEGAARVTRLNCGKSPIYVNDQNLGQVIFSSWKEHRNIAATCDPVVLPHADYVVICINLDLIRTPGQPSDFVMPIDSYASVMRMVGRRIRPDTLVTIESTLPVGMCDKVLYPALCAGYAEQGVDTHANPPLLAYCYERVMPGPGYLQSVSNHWRSFAGVNEESNRQAEAFLGKYVNTKEYPLWRHKSTRAAEIGKLMENAYRATNIAFIEEWAKLAEDTGVDLFDVIASIRCRKGTHDNMMLPGLGVGGYCLTKDALLAAFGAEKLVGAPAELPFSRRAILTNEQMPLRAVEWIKAHFNGSLAGMNALLVGVTYRPGVADTRASPSEIVARALIDESCQVQAYDRLIERWQELPDVTVHSDFDKAIKDKQIVVIALPDPGYRQQNLPQKIAASVAPGGIVIDPWDLIGDQTAKELKDKQIAIRIYGRGDI